MRNLPHPHPISGHATVCAHETRRAVAARKLEPVRHRERRLPPQKDDVPAIDGGLRLVLPATLLARVDLASSPARLARGARVSGNELSVQACQLAVADSDPP